MLKKLKLQPEIADSIRRKGYNKFIRNTWNMIIMIHEGVPLKQKDKHIYMHTCLQEYVHS